MDIKRIKNNYGFTLMEIIVAAVIFSILGTIAIMFFTQCESSWRQLTNESDLRSTGRNDILYMARELGNASNIAIPAVPNNNSITFNLPCNNASTSNSCTVPPAIRTFTNVNDPGYPYYPLVDASRNTQWDTNNAIQYLISNNQLQRLVNGAITHVISSDGSSVTFADSSINNSLNDDEIKITLTLTRTILAGKTLTLTLTGIVKLRSKQ